MRKLVVVVVALVAALSSPHWLYAACGAPVPMQHGFDGWVVCADSRPVSAYAWQVSTPATNTAGLDIACEAQGTVGPLGEECVQPAAGMVGDNQITIETDWSIPAVLGCPTGRVAVSIQCADGTGVILSVSGSDPGLGYLLELAGPGDLTPIMAGSDNARPKVVSQSVVSGQLTASLHFNPVRVACDCDPDSAGFGSGTCTDAFSCTGTAGTVYTRTGPCDSNPAAPTTGWTSTGIIPDQSGNAVISVPLPTNDLCLFIGAPSVLGGVAGSGITGHIRAAGNLAASDRALEVRASAAQGKVTVSFRTDSELEAVSFDIVAKGRVIASTPAKGGNGVGASYEVPLKRGDFQGAKDLVVRTNLRNGGFNTSDAVSF